MIPLEQEVDETLDMVVNELSQDLDSALDFISAEFEADRARAQRYYNGDSDLPVDANRSRYVATKVRDSIRAVRPSLMRTMLSCWYPVEFVPQTVVQGMMAEKQTMYVSQLFYDLGGFKTIYEAFHSAMLFKLGVVKYWYADQSKPIYRKYTGLSEQQVQMVTAHPAVEVISGEAKEFPGPQGVRRTYTLEIVGKKAVGEIKMSWIPLSEFIVNRNATCKDDARVIGHRRNVTKSELVSMGFTPDQLDGLNSDDAEVSRFADESQQRRGYTVFPNDDDTQDESMKEVLFTEAYYRADLDGDGIAELYKFMMGGTQYELLDYERADHIPYALFAIDPEPGTLFGKSIYDLAEKDQDVMTSLTRATVDNFHMTNNPRLAVHEHMVNMEDVLNNELASPIRVRAAGQIQVIDTPFTGQQAIPLLQMLNAGLEEKTGITKAAAGLDPDAMQSTDKDAVRNTIQLAQGQVELMARMLGETGLVELFKGLLHLAMTNLDTNQILRTPEGAQPVQLNAFDPDMATRVEVGTGTGNYEERHQMLNEIYAVQKEALSQFGPGNPMVSLQHMQNTMNDKMRLVGMYNPYRYFGQVTPEVEKKLAETMQQKSQQKEQAQMQIASQQAGALQQAEQIKAEAKIQTDTAKNMLDMQKMQQQGVIDMEKLRQTEQSDFRELMVTDDLARDKMYQDLHLAIVEMQADLAQVKMVQQQQRVN